MESLALLPIPGEPFTVRSDYLNGKRDVPRHNVRPVLGNDDLLQLNSSPKLNSVFAGRRRRGLLAGYLNALSGLFNEFGYDLGFGHVDGVATACFDYSCPSTFCHEPLSVGRNHSIVGCYEIPTGLCLPRWLRDLAIQRRQLPIVPVSRP